jgi:hypothetical protein
MRGGKKTFLAPLLVVSTIGFVTRVAPYVMNGAGLDLDSFRYMELAKGLVTGCGFARRVGQSCAAPEVLRTPGYPMFLVASRSIAASVMAVSLSGAIVILASGMLLGSRWSHRAGLLAAVLMAADLPSISLSSAVMTDALFQSLVAAAVLLEVFGLWSDQPRLAPLLVGALVLGLCSLVRSIGAFLWPFAWVPALAAPIRSLRTRAVLAIMAAVLAIAPVLAWSARNERVANSFTLSTDGPINFYYYLGGAILAAHSHSSIAEQQQSLERQAGVSNWLETPAVLDGFMIRRTAGIIAKHPFTTLRVELFSFLRLALAPEEAWVRGWLNLKDLPYMGEPWYLHMSARARDILQHPVLFLLLLWQVAWLVFVWIGVCRISVLLFTPRAHLNQGARTAIAIMLGVVGVLFVLSAPSGSATAGRLRVAFVPLLAMLAAMGWTSPEISETGGQSASRCVFSTS